MSVDELKHFSKLAVRFNRQHMVADLQVEPVTGRMYFQLPASGTFVQYGETKMEISPRLAEQISVGPDGLPLLVL